MVNFNNKYKTMENIKSYEEFIAESVNESAGYTFAEDSGSGRGTMVLKLEPEAWEKVKNLFDAKGRPINDAVKKIAGAGYSWDLFVDSYETAGKTIRKVYGVSGDYTFGNAPTFYQQKLRGNKNAAKEVLNDFIVKHLK